MPKHFPEKHTLMPILLLGLILRALFFWVGAQHIPPSSDEALTILIAQAIRGGEMPLLFWGAPYQFPLESYLIAPFTSFLPPNAIGARTILLLIGGAGWILFVMGALRAFRSRRAQLMTILLVSLPSPYVLTLTSGYFIPEYTVSYGLCAVLLLLFLKSSERAEKSSLERQFFEETVVCSGFLSGLALSTHLILLPFMLPYSFAMIVRESLQTTLHRAIQYTLPFILGFLPYILTYQSAHAFATEVTGSASLSEILKRLTSGILPQALGPVLGTTVSPFPDLIVARGYLSGFSLGILLFFTAFLLGGVFIRTRSHLYSFAQRRFCQPKLSDIAMGTIIINIAAFLLSSRSDSSSFRYLLPIGWVFPFLIGTGLEAVSRQGPSELTPRIASFLNSILLGVSSFLLLTYCLHSSQILQGWRSEDFANKRELFKVQPVIRFLTNRDIHHCYSTFWFVNRFTFESDGALECSPPFNDRFFGWPLPYKERVKLQNDNMAYVLTESQYSRLKASKFRAMLEKAEIRAKERVIGDFVVFKDFSRDYKERRSRLNIRKENDGILKLTFSKPTNVHSLRLPTSPGMIQIQQDSEEWHEIALPKDEIDRTLCWEDGGPYFFEDGTRCLPMPNTPIHAIRMQLPNSVSVVNPHEIVIYERKT